MSTRFRAKQRIAAELGALSVTLDSDPGSLSTASVDLGSFAGCAIGVWEAGPGTDHDVEADELLVVLSGFGKVTFEDGTSIPLMPGTLVQLRAGERTTWVITERLRKLYVSVPQSSGVQPLWPGPA